MRGCNVRYSAELRSPDDGRVPRLQVLPPCVDDHVIADAGVDVMVQAEVEDPVVMGVERPAWVFAQDGAQGVDERLPEAGPVPARPCRYRDVHRYGAWLSGGAGSAAPRAGCPAGAGPGRGPRRGAHGRRVFRRAGRPRRHDEHILFAIGAKRIAPLWRLLDGIGEGGWHDATGMDGAQVAVADYRPDWWPANTTLLIPPGCGARCSPPA
jgi:hypothetical protein